MRRSRSSCTRRRACDEPAAAWLTADAWLAPQFDYNGDYDTERVLITKGSATLTPDDGSEVVKIGAGDSVYFHKGFACMWHVTKPMAKHYAYVRRCVRRVQLQHTLDLPLTRTSHASTSGAVWRGWRGDEGGRRRRGVE